MFFIIRSGDAFAKMCLSESGKFRVLKNSRTNVPVFMKSSTKLWIMGKINDLVDKNILRKVKDSYVFIEDYDFTGSSTAAMIILGEVCDGLIEWTTSDGEKLGEYLKRKK